MATEKGERKSAFVGIMHWNAHLKASNKRAGRISGGGLFQKWGATSEKAPLLAFSFWAPLGVHLLNGPAWGEWTEQPNLKGGHLLECFLNVQLYLLAVP